MGIITERDLLKQFSKRSDLLGKTKVKEAMVSDVIVGVPDDDLEYTKSVMVAHGMRHLPILAGSKLAGIISIRDVIRAQLEQSKVDIRHLKDYISGGYI